MVEFNNTATTGTIECGDVMLTEDDEFENREVFRAILINGVDYIKGVRNFEEVFIIDNDNGKAK